MILKINSNPTFTLTLKLDVNYDLEYVEFLVILDNKTKNRRDMRQFHGDEFKKALKQYKEWEDMLL